MCGISQERMHANSVGDLLRLVEKVSEDRCRLTGVENFLYYYAGFTARGMGSGCY